MMKRKMKNDKDNNKDNKGASAGCDKCVPKIEFSANCKS